MTLMTTFQYNSGELLNYSTRPPVQVQSLESAQPPVINLSQNEPQGTRTPARGIKWISVRTLPSSRPGSRALDSSDSARLSSTIRSDRRVQLQRADVVHSHSLSCPSARTLQRRANQARPNASMTPWQGLGERCLFGGLRLESQCSKL